MLENDGSQLCAGVPVTDLRCSQTFLILYIGKWRQSAACGISCHWRGWLLYGASAVSGLSSQQSPLWATKYLYYDEELSVKMTSRKALAKLTANIKRSKGPRLSSHPQHHLQSKHNHKTFPYTKPTSFNMHFSLTFLSAVALLGMNQAVGAALEPRAALIATDSCSCTPNTQ